MGYLRRATLCLATLGLLSLLTLPSACSGGDDAAALPDADPAAPDVEVGSLPFLAGCDPNHSEECATGLCFDFNSHGPHCSQPCTSAADCPAPSAGCSGMGVCKGDW